MAAVTTASPPGVIRVGRSRTSPCPLDHGERTGWCTAADRRYAPGAVTGGNRLCVSGLRVRNIIVWMLALV
jgi:hypothetical protein